MSTKRYGVVSTENQAPIEFTLTDDQGRDVGTFRVTAKPRLDLAQAMARAVELKGGIRVYDVDILTYVLREMIIKEEFVDGEWRKAEDLRLLDAVLTSDRIAVPINVLGEIVMDMLSETTGHPTGGSGPSSAGPTETLPTLKDVSASPE